jgi:hypothetical protein
MAVGCVGEGVAAARGACCDDGFAGGFALVAGTFAEGNGGALADVPPGRGNPLPHFGQLHIEPGASGGAFMLPWQCGHVMRGGVLKESCLEIASNRRSSFYSSRGGAERFFNEKSPRKAGAPRRLLRFVFRCRLVAAGVEV